VQLNHYTGIMRGDLFVATIPLTFSVYVATVARRSAQVGGDHIAPLRPPPTTVVLTSVSVCGAMCAASGRQSAGQVCRGVRDATVADELRVGLECLLAALWCVLLSTSTVAFADLCRVASRRVPSCPVVSCRVLSCPVVSCRDLSCRVVSCRVVSCRVVSCRVEQVVVCRAAVTAIVLFGFQDGLASRSPASHLFLWLFGFAAVPQAYVIQLLSGNNPVTAARNTFIVQFAGVVLLIVSRIIQSACAAASCRGGGGSRWQSVAVLPSRRPSVWRVSALCLRLREILWPRALVRLHIPPHSDVRVRPRAVGGTLSSVFT
jgi:hypothetical protein